MQPQRHLVQPQRAHPLLLNDLRSTLISFFPYQLVNLLQQQLPLARKQLKTAGEKPVRVAVVPDHELHLAEL